MRPVNDRILCTVVIYKSRNDILEQIGEINARELQFIKLNKLCMMQLNYFDLLFAIDIINK